ncbi:MAG: hypothetical protein INQ03_24955 [Candidatus Heimdallarchaeota archaeon]|nr:hypothetical protein [Candidatus Heimdallarchaeota archaeon]
MTIEVHTVNLLHMDNEIKNQFEYLRFAIDTGDIDNRPLDIHLNIFGFFDLVQVVDEIREILTTKPEINLNFNIVFDNQVPEDVLLRLFGICTHNNRVGNAYQINLHLALL